MSNGHLKDKIKRILRRHPEGLHILEIARAVKAHRHTVSKYVGELTDSGAVYQRDLGTIKLCYLYEDFNGNARNGTGTKRH